jgi:hypothetical protein
MKTTRLMAVALCAAACTTTTAFAEDDFGIESASPVKIADPVNPQPGMILSGYKTVRYWDKEWLKGSVVGLSKASAIKTIVDKSEEFTLKSLGATESNAGMWVGFLKCKRACVYTLTFTGDKLGHTGYSMRVNGNPVITAASRQTSADVPLRIGWNKIELVCHFSANGARFNSVNIAYKPKESLSDARPLTPAMMFHDQKPEEEW